MNKEDKERIAAANTDIPTKEIEQDILDTEKEIAEMEREAAGYRLVGDRMSNFRADCKESGIRERKIFIEKLQAILDIRNNSKKA